MLRRADVPAAVLIAIGFFGYNAVLGPTGVMAAKGFRAEYAVQPVEPLGLTFTKPGTDKRNLYNDALKALAETAQFEGVKKMVLAAANERNLLLYASDSALPTSAATEQTIRNREVRAHILLTLSIMVLQTRDNLPMVEEAILSFLSIISKLPSDSFAPCK